MRITLSNVSNYWYMGAVWVVVNVTAVRLFCTSLRDYA